MNNSTLVLKSIETAEKTKLTPEEIIDEYNIMFERVYKLEDILNDRVVGSYLGKLSYVIYGLISEMKHQPDKIDKFLDVLI